MLTIVVTFGLSLGVSYASGSAKFLPTHLGRVTKLSDLYVSPSGVQYRQLSTYVGWDPYYTFQGRPSSEPNA